MSLLERGADHMDATDDLRGMRAYLTAGQLAAALAAGIHAAVVPEHLTESLLIGGFFLVVALGQLGLAAALQRRPPVLVVVGAIWAHVGPALAVRRQPDGRPALPSSAPRRHQRRAPARRRRRGNGIPAYPGSRIEPVGVLDLLCLGAEIVLVAALLGLLPARLRSRSASVMVGLGVLAVLARVLGLIG